MSTLFYPFMVWLLSYIVGLESASSIMLKEVSAVIGISFIFIIIPNLVCLWKITQRHQRRPTSTEVSDGGITVSALGTSRLIPFHQIKDVYDTQSRELIIKTDYGNYLSEDSGFTAELKKLLEPHIESQRKTFDSALTAEEGLSASTGLLCVWVITAMITPFIFQLLVLLFVMNFKAPANHQIQQKWASNSRPAR